MLYKHLLKPILFKFDPEKVHDFFIFFGRILGSNVFFRVLTGLFYDYHGTDISKKIDGIVYRTPFMLAAGFDYNAHLGNILGNIGLGGEEVGSVTARPCKGNPKPRLKRLPLSRSIVVNKGLKNDGVDAIIERLKKSQFSIFTSSLQVSQKLQRTNNDQRSGRPKFVTGISIARTNDEKSASVEDGVADYLYSFKRLNEENVGDYYTINISCPNAFGGEAFANPELLTKLLTELKKVTCSKPVYVKMPINISWNQFESLLEIIDKFGLQGVVIGNLNKDYKSIAIRSESPVEFQGGLSGEPCRHLSTELIRKTRQKYGQRFTIIGVGGVMSVESMKEKFDAGADLVQLISGLIFEGPRLVKKLCNAVSQGRTLDVDK